MTRIGVRRLILFLGVVAGLAVATAACRPWTVTDPVVRQRLIQAVERVGNLGLVSDGRMTIRLLPSPNVTIETVSVRALDGAATLDADKMEARLDLLGLLGGHLRPGVARFTSPTAAVDMDRLQPMIDAATGRSGATGALDALHTAGVTFRGGVVRLLSRNRARDMTLTGVTATFAWPRDDAEISLSGSATWRGVAGDFALDVDHPAELRRGGQALASVRLKSSVLDLDAAATLSDHGLTGAVGELSAATTDLAGFLRVVGAPFPQLAPIRTARLHGKASLDESGLSLDRVALDLDGMAFDGALVARLKQGRTSVAGTLASEDIDLGRFLGALPSPMRPGGAWNTDPLDTAAVAFDDIDLRVSAATARIGSLVIEDGSLSLQSGNGRMELSLGEARAYDGLLKGRVVVTVEQGVTALRADATLSRLDVGAMLRDLPERYPASGLMTGHFTIDAQGSSPAEMVRDLGGRGQLAVRSGELGGRTLTALVRAAPSANVRGLSLSAGSLPFDSASFDFTLDKGVATLADSAINWPAVQADVRGTVSLPVRRLDMTATLTHAQTPDADASYAVAGPWGDLTLNPTRARY